MDNLHHELWLVHAVNVLLGPPVAAGLESLGFHVEAGADVIPDYLVMAFVVAIGIAVLCAIMRTRLSVEQPGRVQIVLEDLVTALNQLMRDYIGPTAPRYLPLVGTIGLFIFVANMIGKVPGFMSPTASINVTLGCAITVWVYYHIQGLKVQGAWNYVKHFALPPGVPVFMAPLMFFIEIISHLSRVLSLSLRLFGNVFGEELVVLIMASIIPFLVPLPMMVLGVVTGTLQAFIFVLLTIVYLAGAVNVEHEHSSEHGGAH